MAGSPNGVGWRPNGAGRLISLVLMVRAGPYGERESLALEQGLAAPKDASGSLDWQKAHTGDDLREFVNLQLFPYLHGFRERGGGPNTIELQDRPDLRRDQEQDPERL